MSFKRKADTTQGEQAKLELGDSLTGVYLGSFDHEGDYGPTKKHLFKTEKGIKVIFGQRHLTDLLADEKPGVLVRVTYTENKKMRKGNPMKMYTLDIDDEYQASEEEVTDAVSAAESEDVDGEETADYADEVTTAPAKARPTATVPDAARQKRVQDLLKRAGNKATA